VSKSRRKVAFIVADGGLGGGTTHVLQLVKGLPDTYEISVVTEKNSHLAMAIQALGAAVYPVNLFGPLAATHGFLELISALRHFNPDIVHAHGSRAGFFAAIATAMTGKPLSVYTNHGLHFSQKYGVQKLFGIAAERLTTGRAAAVIYVSQSDLQKSVAMRTVIAEKAHVVRNGIEIPQRRVARARKWDVAFIGRLVHPKDPLLFIDALRGAKVQNALVIGAGELRNAMIEKARAYGLLGRIVFLGELPHEQVLKILPAVGVVVMTSRWEGLPILPLEAISLGVPVVATAVGGVPEIIDGGAGGVLVRRDSEEIRAAMERVLVDTNYREMLISKGRARLREEFSIQVTISKIINIYQKVVRGAGAP